MNDGWSSDTTLDNSSRACCPDMAAGPDGVYAVWETGLAGSIHPAWSLLQNDAWTSVNSLSVAPGAEAWYPDITLLSDGTPVVTWSSRSSMRNTFDMKVLPLPNLGPYQLYIPVSLGT